MHAPSRPVPSTFRGGTLLVALALVTLAGCATGDDPTPSKPATEASATPAAAAPGGTAEAPSTDVPAAPDAPALPTSCAAISLVEGTQVTGDDLGQCLEDFERAARTGSSLVRLTPDDPGVETQWLHADDGTYALLTGRDGGDRVVVTPDGGASEDEGRWVRADAGGSFDEQLASSHVEALRPQVQPDFQAALVRLSDTWLVEGREEVTVLDGAKRSLWRIASTKPVELFGGMPADVSLYMDVPGATEVMISTGGGNTSERLYGAWGAPVDATAVEKAVAQALR